MVLLENFPIYSLFFKKPEFRSIKKLKTFQYFAISDILNTKKKNLQGSVVMASIMKNSMKNRWQLYQAD